ncbi:hypothetical protein [Sphingomonas sp. LaA6.9]|uniref:hypothetical protein n=1 Tax=Sphingomonas sp. LaA6.9 TaxID=2919914 RepID=UPI001F4FE0AA|nr:hypothetical protein [Sphingomonas sp. LaA6.9]MCJ8159873.1 hypothetical protein [Sphingomonas sp. LaA6.9]
MVSSLATALRSPRVMGMRLGHDHHRHTAMVLGCALALMASIFCLSFARLEFSRTAVTTNNCILGADTASYARALANQQYSGLKPRKHPLAAALVGGLARPLIAAGISPAVAGSLALALIQAVGAGLIFAFLYHGLAGGITAALVAALALSTFGTVTIFGVVETYGVTVMAIALACLAFAALAPRATGAPRLSGAAAGAAGAVIGLANPPALAFLLIYTGLSWRHVPGGWISRLCATLLLPAAIASLGVVLPALIFDPVAGLAWQELYLQRYASASNFTDPRIIGDYLASFFLFAFVAPLDHVQCRYVVADVVALLRDPMRASALLGIGGVCVTGIVRGLTGGTRGVVLAALGSVAALFIFYLFFNPDEALLYSSQWTLALMIAAAPGLGSGVRSAAALVVALALSLSVNIAPLHNRASADPRACCPAPPATMLDRERPLHQPWADVARAPLGQPGCISLDARETPP